MVAGTQMMTMTLNHLPLQWGDGEMFLLVGEVEKQGREGALMDILGKEAEEWEEEGGVPLLLWRQVATQLGEEGEGDVLRPGGEGLMWELGSVAGGQGCGPLP